MYDKQNDRKFILRAGTDLSKYPLENYTPIGIVVIPASHTPEGRPRVMSLAEMSCDTPETGSTTEYNSMIWGGDNTGILDLASDKQYPYLSPLAEDGIVNYNNDNSCYLPSDAFRGEIDNPLNLNEGYDKEYLFRMCSPYK